MVLLFNIYPSICPIGRKELCFSFNAAKGQNIIILCVCVHINQRDCLADSLLIQRGVIKRVIFRLVASPFLWGMGMGCNQIKSKGTHKKTKTSQVINWTPQLKLTHHFHDQSCFQLMLYAFFYKQFNHLQDTLCLTGLASNSNPRLPDKSYLK